jgi:hypothetical protein
MNLATTDTVATVLTHTWQLTLLLLAVWCTSRLLRRRPQIGYGICLVIVCKCILPPVWSSPTSVFSWMQRQAAEPTTAVSAAPQAAEEIADDDRYVFAPMPVHTVIDDDQLRETVAAAAGPETIPFEEDTADVPAASSIISNSELGTRNNSRSVPARS